MSAGFKSGPPPKLGQSGGLPAAAPGSQALLLDKFNRRSTPDSEALASSDEETDINLNNSRPDFHNNHHTAASLAASAAAASNTATATAASTHMSQGQQPLSQVQPPQSQSQSQSQAQQQPPKPVRRASWLNDTSQGLVRPRNESFNSASMSPTTSHPSTPAIDASTAGGAGAASSSAATWGAHAASSAGVLNRAHSNASTAFPWGTAMWNSERKDPPSRLSEVLPSPTSAIPPGSTGGSFFSGANAADSYPSQTSPATRDGLSTTSQIPFAIPLHPTPKTYRSQSYSVGQLEPDVAALTGSATSPSLTSSIGGGGSSLLAGSRSGRPIAGLQHRPSRPSMLSEMSNDGGMLGKVKEVDDDDDESTNDSPQGSQHLTAEAKTIEMLTRENAMLRQHASQQYHNARIRPRASTGAAYRLDNGYGLQESVPEESSDYAIDELDEINDGDFATAAKRATTRRMSEFAAPGSFRSPFSVENRKLESVKKAFWQTAPAGFSDVSPSRRHSFADIPTRQASISSISEVVLAHEANAQEQQQSGGIEFTSPFDNAHSFAAKSAAAAAAAAQSMYGNGPGVSPGASQISPQQLIQQQQHQQAQQQQQHSASAAYGGPGGAYPSSYGLHAPTYAARPTSPQRGMYGLSQPNRSTPLHIVLFKCARADVFYIQEGTGLTVKPGDLVIVEADRGTDLGTVAVDNVDWVEARRLKEHYAEEQYKWLMMYSQNAAAAQDGVGAGLMASSTGLQGSAIGGMGPPGQHHVQEPSTSELKPKLIKRLAQNHEIHALRDKEGNEAKAKRVCMQKVKEHGLNMEILDAEFQMDWKKLTFYYFADAYINFNSLVTDLFKIYKTRIWMSAINPASFASQPLGLQAPSGIGPGAVGVNRGAPTSERRPQQGGQVSPPPPQATSQQQQQQQVHQQQHQSAYSPVPSNRGYPGGVSPQPPAMAGPGGGPNAGYPGSFPYSPYAAFGNVPRASGIGYGGQGIGGPAPNENYAMGYATSADYHMMRNRFPAGQPDINQNGQGMSPLAPSGEWVGAFQGLSLNTR
ncbi:hypothetical protein Sste5346_001879 [Sporothrix stenoceras]|uniref:PSP1 C-terminal domain-containing protein n=1 Tax=Sporothrix stenoceras TaxID=5173 RepID=A0ABR3ZMT5_9PEZI